ncbi:MAG: PEP-CTERM system histidine kinase PrsK [Verrucomicrobiae bacterium]|nr:PEP-CTERM system histidine kinase PrsK [Verrucomicrobiae bacterium]
MDLSWLSLGAALFATALGVVVFRRSPRHPAHWSFAIGMALIAAETVLAALAQRAPHVLEQAEWQRVRLTVAALLPIPWLIFSRCYSRGDALTVLEGRTLLLLAAVVLPLSLAVTFHSSLVVLPEPGLFADPIPRLGWAGMAVQVFVLLAAVGVLTHLERTFRGSVGVMRWRLKYMVLGVAVLFGYRLYASSQAVLYQIPEQTFDRAATAALLVACVLISIALTRGTVFDVDVYPSQTLLYRSLTVLLAGSYLVIVGALSHLVGLLGGDSSFPAQAFLIFAGLAGLAVLLLSERFRQRLRTFVSRHLRRPVYDYRQIWSTFTAQTTSLVDEESFSRTVARWVSDTFQSLSVSVWLVESSGDHLRMSGSTVLADAAADGLDQPTEELAEALAAIGQRHEPFILNRSRDRWAVTLERLHPGVFREGGSQVCQPLNAGGKLLGLLILGDRVAGVPFTTEDFDLLRCIGDQIAASLLGLQLSAQLLRAKEMEAFQTMSAFFVHDLKNTASTLSLTLQNLGQHFSDPAFREDALRAVGKSVQHLNGLIARLSRLRQELRVQAVPGDLVAIIESALSSVGSSPSAVVENNAQPLPPVLVDAEQFEKVVVNLLVNAREAVASNGHIRIDTRRQDNWACLSVADNGCGMSPEFLHRSLFRPFQTTKRNGLGIGMFHSRMIVEAHHGRMEVESTPGHGTTVRVLLPFAPIV